MFDTEPYRVPANGEIRLRDRPTDDDGGLKKKEGEKQMESVIERLRDLQELLFAEHKQKVLVVLQAMDAGGKDSTIRHVFGPLNPQGCRVVGFKAPTARELAQDYLWRIHRHTPRAGHISVFNRSHYEDVLIVRVLNLVPKDRWQRRYEQINAFEQMLSDEGTTILKFYLHISKDYQKQRFQRRLERPDKHWKFNPADLSARDRWEDYQAAYEAALSRCSTPNAPWYVVPAECRWFRNLLIARVLADRLESLDMKYPEPNFDPASVELE